MDIYPPAPEVAVLRMAAVLTATGVSLSDGYLVARAVAARGILMNPGNLRRYGAIVDALVLSGDLDAEPSNDLDAHGIITVTDKGRAYLDELATP